MRGSGAGLAVEKGREVSLEGAPAAPLREVGGHLIGAGDCCVYASGVVISVSRMGVSQLRAELAARGLPGDGLRNTLYRRVQARTGPSLLKLRWPGKRPAYTTDQARELGMPAGPGRRAPA